MTGILDRVIPGRVRTLDHWTGASSAVCIACDWQRHQAEPERWRAVRAAAHRHVARTGHPVRAVREDRYTYGSPLDAAP